MLNFINIHEDDIKCNSFVRYITSIVAFRVTEKLTKSKN